MTLKGRSNGLEQAGVISMPPRFNQGLSLSGGPEQVWWVDQAVIAMEELTDPRTLAGYVAVRIHLSGGLSLEVQVVEAQLRD